MAVAFVRGHQSGRTTQNGGSWVAQGQIITAAVSAGNVLILAYAYTGSEPITAIAKPGGETASWVQIVDGPGVEIWAITTTVVWPVGTPVTITTPGTSRRAYTLSEFSGVQTVERTPYSVASTTFAVPGFPATTIAPLPGDLVLGFGRYVTYPGLEDISDDPDTLGGAWSAGAAVEVGSGSDQGLIAFLQHKIPSVSATQTFNPGGSQGFTYGDVVAVALKMGNVAPTAPTLTSMASGGNIDRANTNRASHAFSDPNPGDSQSGFDLRVRLVGAPTWTTIHQDVPNQFYDFPGGYFAVGDYERQVRTYDALGAVGPYSSSGFFTATDAPTGPTITSPLNGSSVPAVEELVWSVSNQDAYQWRRLADDAGSPDTATVYEDSGEITSSATRAAALAFPVNDRPEHLQLRVKYDGLWSPWSSVAVEVSYTPPPTPVVTISADATTASLLIQITNPIPGEGEPDTMFNEVYVDDGSGEERRVTALSTSTPWRYWTPVSGRDYANSIRVVAVAANGTTSSSS